MQKNIILFGIRGTGKTTFGKALSQDLDRPFFDMDEVIVERTGKTINQIVDEEGWDAFRNLEHQLSKELSEKTNTVISTGGGTFMYFNNAELLKKNGILILLRAEPEFLAQQIHEATDRPSLTGKDFREEMTEVWQRRKETYEKTADIIIDTDQLEDDQVIEEIKRQVFG